MTFVWKLDRRFSFSCVLFFLALSLRADSQNPHAEKLINITTSKQGGATHFFVENLQSAAVTVTIELDLKNLNTSNPLPYTATIQPKSRTEAFALQPANTNADSTWSYTYFATWGSLDVTHDDTYLYALPYSAGKTFRVSQGYDGHFSHTGGDKYAIDWNMPLGTEIRAAREGIVVGSKDDSDLGGPEKKFEWDANYVLVEHSDGTLGQYVHLLKGGNQVKVGDKVQVGSLLGLSGNTGFTTGPHLHFAVFKAASGKSRQTMPIQYKTSQGPSMVLSEGKSYKAM